MQVNLSFSFAFLWFLIIISQRNACWYEVSDINAFINPTLHLRCIIVKPAINLAMMECIFSAILAYLQNSLKPTQGAYTANSNDEASVSSKQHIYLQLIFFWFVNAFFDVYAYSIPIVTKKEFNVSCCLTSCKWSFSSGPNSMSDSRQHEGLALSK